ncbi:MAG: zinc ribbon domain-containing protein [Clostridiales bacterium]|nr:zinc ribbon domain-containing protein [Clostridiales bacterium]
MSKCNKCGSDNPVGNKYCGQCGALLPQNEKCASCGATLREDAAFCGQCGAPRNKRYAVCGTCGAKLAPDSAFCYNCGAAVNGGARQAAVQNAPVQRQAPMQKYAPAPKKSAGKNIADAKNKVAAFEKKHSVIVNGIIAVFAVVFILISLFAPIKMTATNPANAIDDESSVGGAFSTGSVCEIDQSIWQVFGSIKYTMIDMSDPSDRKLLQDVKTEVVGAEYKVLIALRAWAEDHPYATEDAAKAKFAELYEKYMSDVNYLAYQFAITAVGALDYLEGEEVEAEMEDMLVTMRNTAVLTLVMSLVAVAVHLGIAVISLVFLIFAIIGMVRKRQCRLFAFLLTTLITAGVGMSVLFISPQLYVGGGLFAVALTAALLYFMCAIGKTVMEGKDAQFIVKRAVCSGITIIAFFMMCSYVLSCTMDLQNMSVEIKVVGPLGIAFESIITMLYLNSYGIYGLRYSNANIAAAIVVLAIGLCAFVLLYAAMLKSLKTLAYKTDCKAGIDALSLASAIALIAFAIVPAILAASIAAPSTYDTLRGNAVAVLIKYAVRAYVYVAMAFAIAAFVFELVFRPKLKAGATPLSASQRSETVIAQASAPASFALTSDHTNIAQPAVIAEPQQTAEVKPEQGEQPVAEEKTVAAAVQSAVADKADAAQTMATTELDKAVETETVSAPKKPSAKKPVSSKSATSKSTAKKPAKSASEGKTE